MGKAKFTAKQTSDVPEGSVRRHSKILEIRSPRQRSESAQDVVAFSVQLSRSWLQAWSRLCGPRVHIYTKACVYGHPGISPILVHTDFV